MNLSSITCAGGLRRALTGAALTGLFSALFLPAAPALRPATSNKVATAVKPMPPSKAQLQADFGKQPLRFEANQGQTDAEVKFTAAGAGYALFLTPQEAVLSVRQTTAGAEGEVEKADEAAGRRGAVAHNNSAPRNLSVANVRIRLAGANPVPNVVGREMSAGLSNYFGGDDRAQWHTDIPSFARVTYEDVYPGVEMIWHGAQQALEYDFVVAPGADPRQIALEFNGAQNLRVDESGALHLQTAAGEVVQHAPVIYQDTPQGRQTVSGNYVIDEAGRVRFALGSYDTAQPLVIDPVLSYAVYVGGSATDEVNDVAVDDAGNVYVVGETFSTDFAATLRIGDSGLLASDSAAYVRKLNASGQTVYTVVLNGRSLDEAHGVAVDETGAVYVVGDTASRNFPLQSPYQSTPNPGFTCLFINCVFDALFYNDAFVTKINPQGNSLVFSTLLGGGKDELGAEIAVGPDHAIYVAGSTSSGNFPTLNAFQEDQRFSSFDGFLTVFAPSGQALRYSTYFGSGGLDNVLGMTLDASGNVYLAGRTDGDDLPVRGANGAAPFRAQPVAGLEGFAAKFNPNVAGNVSLLYATYFGGAGTDEANDIAVDDVNRAYVTGLTGSFDFPLQAAPGAPLLRGQNVINEAFLLALNSTGTGLVFSTFLGGSGQDFGHAVTLDTARNIYVTGPTTSADFATTTDVQAGLRGGFDVFLTKVRAGGTAIEFTVLLGSTGDDVTQDIALDESRRIYLAGAVSAGNLTGAPTPAPAGRNGFVARIEQPGVVRPDSAGYFDPNANVFNLRNALDSGVPSFTAFFGAPGDLPITGDWDGDGVSTIGLFRPSTGQFFLHNRIESTGTPDITFNFGQAGDLPVAGDWDGDGVDTVGVFRAGTFLLRATNNAGFSRVNSFTFGTAAALPVVGDWDGDGRDTVGVFEYPGAGSTQLRVFRLRNSNSAGPADFAIGTFSILDKPLAGDWDGDGVDTIGVLRVTSTTTTFLLRRVNNTDTSASNLLTFSIAGSNAGDFPLSGDWDGLP